MKINEKISRRKKKNRKMKKKTQMVNVKFHFLHKIFVNFVKDKIEL